MPSSISRNLHAAAFHVFFRNVVLLVFVLRSRDDSMSLVSALLKERKSGAQDHAVLVCLFGYRERSV